MRVESIRAAVHSSPLTRPFITAARRTDHVEYVVVTLELRGDDGKVSVGQGSAAETVKVTGESAATIVEAVHGPLANALQGADGDLAALASSIADALPGATSAKAAVDVALHDAVARSRRVPMGELLAALPQFGPWEALDLGAGIANDMTVSLDDPRVMADRARDAAATGVRILKIKLGNDPEQDRRRLAAVVEVVPDACLRLDANQGWSAGEAVELIARLSADGLPIDLVEQPVPARDIDGLARVTRESPIPIMADESLWSPVDAAQLIDAGAADLFNIKLAKTGGLQPALDIARIAHDAGVECMVGAMMEPRISITAAAHLALAHPAVTMIDLDSPAWFARNVPNGGYREADGTLTLVGGAGLGLEYLEDPTP